MNLIASAVGMTILILNGPNLNLLGQREPEKYGKKTLGEVEAGLQTSFPDLDLLFFQSNHHGTLIDRLHGAHNEGVDGIVFNPAGYTHNSVALRDAVSAIDPPVIEVHLSNIYAREEFRQHSMLAPVCAGQITGLGPDVYRLAVEHLVNASFKPHPPASEGSA